MITPQLQYTMTTLGCFMAYFWWESRPSKRNTYEIESTFLAPGDCYILTMTYMNSRYLIKLWDIGFSDTPSLPIASTRSCDLGSATGS